jgi:fibro-slime domain-containing protein
MQRWIRIGLLCGAFAASACSSDRASPGGEGSGDAGSALGDGGRPGDGGASGAGDAGSTGGGGGGGSNGGGNSDGDGGMAECGALKAVMRDFQDTHPDFETYAGSGATKGIVEAALGADKTPVYANPAYASGARQTTDAASFADWYHDVAGVNERFVIDVPLTETSPGTFVYDSNDNRPAGFFPLDGKGFGNQGRSHNYHFTTEIHTRFTYRGGELFKFRGDDDVWVFVNDKLAVDLGGLHVAVEGTIDFDALADQLGIRVGETYEMDIFHAERHTVESNFRIETSIDCFMPVVLG